MVEKGYKMGGDLPEGVDPRLDNRQGASRPPLESDPAVPQQVDGPDVVHQAEHAKAVEGGVEVGVSVQPAAKGMHSPGDHSLGEEAARLGNDAGQAADTLETDPDSDSSAPTAAPKAKAKAKAGK